MKITFTWEQPVLLLVNADPYRIYSHNSEKIRNEPGVYAFCYKNGAKDLVPFYIGQSLTLNHRIGQHFNDMKKMRKLRGKRGGDRYLLHGYPAFRKSQDADKALNIKALNIIESAFITYAVESGFDLNNIIGAKRKYHELSIRGNRESKAIFGGHTMYSNA